MGGKAKRVTDLMQVIAELTNECFFAALTGQEPSIGRQRIRGTKESEASDQFTHKGIHGHHTFIQVEANLIAQLLAYRLR